MGTGAGSSQTVRIWNAGEGADRNGGEGLTLAAAAALPSPARGMVSSGNAPPCMGSGFADGVLGTLAGGRWSAAAGSTTTWSPSTRRISDRSHVPLEGGVGAFHSGWQAQDALLAE